MLKVQNKYNYPILIILLLWFFFVTYFLFEVTSHSSNSGGMMVILSLSIVTILLLPICAIIITITNKICKLKYNSDLEFVAIPYIAITFLFGFYILYETLI